MKSLVVLSMYFVVSVADVATSSPGKRNETLDDFPGPTTFSVRDGQNSEITPTVTTTKKVEGDEALETENHLDSIELDKLSNRLADAVKKEINEFLHSREKTSGSQQTMITKTKEEKTKLTPEDDITKPKVTETTKRTTRHKPPTTISPEAKETTVTETATTKFTNATRTTTTAKPTKNFEVSTAKVTTVKPTTNVTVTRGKTTTNVTTTPNGPIEETTTAKTTKKVTTTKKKITPAKPTTKAAKVTKTASVAKPSTKATVATEKKTTDKTPTPKKPTKKISEEVYNGTNETSTVNATTKEPDGDATPSNTPTAASRFDPRTLVRHVSNFPIVFMVAIALTVFLAMGYYNRRKIQNTMKKTCNVKEKTDRGYVKVKLEDDVELPRDANREYVY